MKEIKLKYVVFINSITVAGSSEVSSCGDTTHEITYDPEFNGVIVKKLKSELEATYTPISNIRWFKKK